MNAIMVKHFSGSTFLFIWLVFLAHDAYGDETYYIDNSPLFIYKTINWWYDCLPEESNLLCGRYIRCANDGNAQVEYDEMNEKLELNIMDGFASMLLAFKQCRQCYGPSYFQHHWLDQKYFKGATATAVLDDTSTIKGFTFSHIKKEQARQLKRLKRDLQFVLEGAIGGLANGRIALHGSGHLLKKCMRGSHGQDEIYPISLKINNVRTNETLAVFDMVWKHTAQINQGR